MWSFLKQLTLLRPLKQCAEHTPTQPTVCWPVVTLNGSPWQYVDPGLWQHQIDEKNARLPRLVSWNAETLDGGEYTRHPLTPKCKTP